MARILAVDDDQYMRTSLVDSLGRAGHDVDAADSGARALELVAENSYDVAITDLKMPKMTGLELLDALRDREPGLSVIVITAHGTVETAVQAMKRGAADYIQKPFGADALELTVARVLERRRLLGENEAMRREIRSKADSRPLLGNSDAMNRVRERIRAVAGSDATVLVRGETGTGKELVSRAIHAASPRADRPYLCVNCAALSAGLLESELFGHEKGAFTGADRQRAGRFELADGGTLLLDEVSEIEPRLQAKLLRVLQEREFERVGSGKTRKVDVRVIATTNRALEDEVREGNFREDLYYRLAIVPIEIPSLRERNGDVTLLAEHFKDQAERRAGRTPRPFANEALGRLGTYTWPGNVRELQNIVERAVLLSAGEEVTVDDLGTSGPLLVPTEEIRSLGGQPLADIERLVIEETLALYDGHQKKSAQSLGIGVRTLRDKMKRWGLRAGQIPESVRARERVTT